MFDGLKYPTNKGESNRHGHQQPLKYQNKRLFKLTQEGESMRPRHIRQTTLPMLRQEKEKQDQKNKKTRKVNGDPENTAFALICIEQFLFLANTSP